MRLFYSKLIGSLLLAGVSTGGYSASKAQWIFGAENAKSFHAQGTKNYYITVGAFHAKRNAQKMQHSLQKKHVSAVHISSKNNVYTVFVGPVTSAEAVRAVGEQLTGSEPVSPRVTPKKSHSHAVKPFVSSVMPAESETNSLRPMPVSNTKVITLGIGSSWTHGSTVTAGLTPQVINTYVADKKARALMVGELFGGVENELSPGWAGQLGVTLALSGKAAMSGDIWENADPNFNNYSYKYSINRTYVGLKGQLLKDTTVFGLKPYVNGSVGLGFNHAYGYNSRSKLFEEVVSPPFGSNVSTAFSYTAGVGVQKSLNSQWSTGVSYEFSDWGRSHLATAPGQSSRDSLVLNHLYNNSVFINLSYYR